MLLSKTRTILSIQNDVKTSGKIKDALSSLNVCLLCCESIRQAELLLIKHFDEIEFILCDFELKNETALNFLEQQHQISGQIPVIILSSSNDLSIIKQCIKNGAHDFIQKPFDAETLIERMELVSRHHDKELHKRAKHKTHEMSFFGNYQLLNKLGEGNMGKVYLAIDIHSHNKYALKILKVCFENLDEEESLQTIARFETEARSTFGISHENLIRVHDYGVEGTRPYIVMEYFKSDNLTKYMENDLLNLESKLDIISQIALGLSEIHKNGICHRDIKPSNILINKDGKVKLADFGIALNIGHQDLTKNDIIGSPNYLSPEAFEASKTINHQSDIFSLGTLSYELISKERPFQAENIYKIADNIRNKQQKPLSQIIDKLLPQISRMVDRMLEKERKNRYQTAKIISKECQDIIKLISQKGVQN